MKKAQFILVLADTSPESYCHRKITSFLVRLRPSAEDYTYGTQSSYRKKCGTLKGITRSSLTATDFTLSLDQMTVQLTLDLFLCAQRNGSEVLPLTAMPRTPSTQVSAFST